MKVKDEKECGRLERKEEKLKEGWESESIRLRFLGLL